MSGQKLRLNILDGFSLDHPTKGRVQMVNRKASALFSYLALSPNGVESRERLAGLFWSECSESQARSSLRQSLKYLADTFQRIGFDGFSRNRWNVQVAQDALEVDIHCIAGALRRGTISTAAVTEDAQPERILYGYEALDPAFTAWLTVTRQAWQQQFVEWLQHIIHADDNDSGLAAGLVHRAAATLVQIDPTHEDAQCALMRSFTERGNIPAALKQYNQLYHLLDAEYDMEPAPETQALCAAIKLGEIPRHRTGAERENRFNMTAFRRELSATLTRFHQWVRVEEEASETLPGSDDSAIRMVITLRPGGAERYL